MYVIPVWTRQYMSIPMSGSVCTCLSYANICSDDSGIFQSFNRAVTTARNDRSKNHVTDNEPAAHHNIIKPSQSAYYLITKRLWEHYVIYEQIISFRNTLSYQITIHPWPTGIIDEHNISSRITSCSLRMKCSIYAHIIPIAHGLYHPRAHHLSMNTSWHHTKGHCNSWYIKLRGRRTAMPPAS